MKKEGTFAGLRVGSVAPASIQPNPWNPNKMDAATFEKEKRSIKTHGFVDPVTVRERGDGVLEIVDGEHRWRAAIDLGLSEIPVVNLGKIDDQRAKKLTLIYNELRGAPDPARLSALMVDLTQSGDALALVAEALSAELPFSAVEIASLVTASTMFTWGDDPATMGTGGAASKKAAETAKFRLGGVQGAVSAPLVKGLLEEFGRSAEAVSSSEVEAVLGDWLERLRKTAPVIHEKAPETPVLKKKKKA